MVVRNLKCFGKFKPKFYFYFFITRMEGGGLPNEGFLLPVSEDTS